MIVAYMWPDGDYQTSEDEDAPYSWKSDDYVEVIVPDEVDDLDDYMHQLHLEVNLGHSCERKTL